MIKKFLFDYILYLPCFFISFIDVFFCEFSYQEAQIIQIGTIFSFISILAYKFLQFDYFSLINKWSAFGSLFNFFFFIIEKYTKSEDYLYLIARIIEFLLIFIFFFQKIILSLKLNIFIKSFFNYEKNQNSERNIIFSLINFIGYLFFIMGLFERELSKDGFFSAIMPPIIGIIISFLEMRMFNKKNIKIKTFNNSIEENSYDKDKKINELKNIINDKNKIIQELQIENDKSKNEVNNQKSLIEELNKQIKEKNIIIEEYKNSESKRNNINNNEKKYNDNDFGNVKEIKDSKGSYGAIYSAICNKDNKEVCLKKIDINYMKLRYKEAEYPEDSYLKDLNNEIKILKLLSSNQNSVEYIGDYEIIKEKVIIMEKCDANLEDFLKNQNKSFSINEIKKIFIGLNKVFYFLYRNNIVHRDIKLKNFLIKYTNNEKTEFIVKLADYGLEKFLKETNKTFSGLKGSQETVAPELILKKVKNYDSKMDIFSLGIVLYQLSHKLKHPFDYNTIIYMEYYENDNFNISFDSKVDNDDFKDLVKKMLKLNPIHRLTWDQYFNHPFFKRE